MHWNIIIKNQEGVMINVLGLLQFIGVVAFLYFFIMSIVKKEWGVLLFLLVIVGFLGLMFLIGFLSEQFEAKYVLITFFSICCIAMYFLDRNKK